MVEAVKRGFPQREIADAAFELQTRDRSAASAIVVGVNDSPRGRRASRSQILRIDPALERKQIGRVRAVRARRDGAAVERGARRAQARRRADERRNLMPNLLDCARVHATEGEIVGALQEVFGTYTETPSSSRRRSPCASSLPSSLAAVVAGAFAAQALAATSSVKVGDNYFVRSSGVPTVTVSKGTTVRWNCAGRSTAQRDRQARPREVPLGHEDARRSLRQEADASGDLPDHLHDPRGAPTRG